MKTKAIILLAGVALLAACKGKQGYEFANNKSNADTATSISAVVKKDIQTEKPKLIKTADINFKVKNARRTGDSVVKLTTYYNGLVMHHDLTSQVTRDERIRLSNDSIRHISVVNTIANMTLRIPSDKLEDFVNRVGEMAIHVDSLKLNIEDKSADYLSAELKAKNRAEWITQKQQPKPDSTADAVLSMKDGMVDSHINNIKTNDAVKYSVLTLSFYQNNTVINETLPNDDPSVYQAPFFNRLWMSVSNGWFMFAEIIFMLTNFWVLAVIGLTTWLIYKKYKKNHPALKA